MLLPAGRIAGTHLAVTPGNHSSQPHQPTHQPRSGSMSAWRYRANISDSGARART
jgi:hypothetical protein